LKDLAEKGLFFLNSFNNEPPQHLETFIDFVKEYISFVSNRSSGACGLPNLIPYMYYLIHANISPSIPCKTNGSKHFIDFGYVNNNGCTVSRKAT
jgi:anaerobic ribonucleoside-triphosphate reductase